MALKKEEIEFIQKNKSSGDFYGIPWIGVPNMPGREPFTFDEIVEALQLRVEKDNAE